MARSGTIRAMMAACAGLFAWSFAAATFLPLSSEVRFAYLVHTRGETVLPVMVATVGNYLGACTTYWMARLAAGAVERRRRGPSTPTSRQVRALAFLRRKSGSGPPLQRKRRVP